VSKLKSVNQSMDSVETTGRYCQANIALQGPRPLTDSAAGLQTLDLRPLPAKDEKSPTPLPDAVGLGSTVQAVVHC